MESIQSIRLKVGRRPNVQFVFAKQGDSDTRYLKVTVYAGDEKLIPENGAVAKIRARRPDGRVFAETGTINGDGTITVEMTEDIIKLKGTVKADIAIYGSGDSVLSTEVFYIKVQEAPILQEV